MQGCNLRDPPFPNIVHRHPASPGKEIRKDQIVLMSLLAYWFSDYTEKHSCVPRNWTRVKQKFSVNIDRDCFASLAMTTLSLAMLLRGAIATSNNMISWLGLSDTPAPCYCTSHNIWQPALPSTGYGDWSLSTWRRPLQWWVGNIRTDARIYPWYIKPHTQD